MQKQLENPPFTPLFRIVTGAEIVVVGLAGIGLFFLPILAKPQWPWIMTPFNMAFLGAAYLSSIAAICVMFWGGNWASARLGLWMLVAFTVPILILSLLHLDRFEFLRWATWVWFFLFITIAPYSAYNIWKNRHLPPADTIPLPALWRSYLLIQGIALGLYGIALIIAPNIFTAFWPWRIDEFHGQIYSAIFLTGAAGSIVIWFSASRIELLML